MRYCPKDSCNGKLPNRANYCPEDGERTVDGFEKFFIRHSGKMLLGAAVILLPSAGIIADYVTSLERAKVEARDVTAGVPAKAMAQSSARYSSGKTSEKSQWKNPRALAASAALIGGIVMGGGAYAAGKNQSDKESYSSKSFNEGIYGRQNIKEGLYGGKYSRERKMYLNQDKESFGNFYEDRGNMGKKESIYFEQP